MVLSPKERKRRELQRLADEIGSGCTAKAIEHVSLDDLIPYDRNARTHSEKQIYTLERSLQSFGFINPVLIGEDNSIVAGHGRVEAAKRIGMTAVPALRLEGLSADQLRAYRLADNRLAELAGWDDELVAIELRHLCDVELDFGIEAIGWDATEIDILIEAGGSSDPAADDDADDNVPDLEATAISAVGDLWLLGKHRLLCGSAIEAEDFDLLMQGQQAQMVIQDPPWNIPVSTISGKGKTKHREFVMASGEMSDEEFILFLKTQLEYNRIHAAPNAVLEVFIDWRGVAKVITAAETLGLKLLNICVWAKTNGGMGTPWRSQHEFVAVFASPGTKYKDNVQLGRFGRYRTNVWQMAGQNSFNAERAEALQSHPTRKPVALIADAIRDVTDRGDIVLDSFMGSGTTIMAAQQTGRIAYGLELDPRYVDTIVRRWEAKTGIDAMLESTGQIFAEVSAERNAAAPSIPIIRHRERPLDGGCHDEA